MKPVFALVATGLLLAGCGEQPETVHEREAKVAATAKALSGWDRAFGVPSSATGAANQFGFGVGPYAAAKTGFAATGRPIMMSNSGAADPSIAIFTLEGAKADLADHIVFALKITDPIDVETARQRFAQTIGDFMGKFDIRDGGAVGNAILANESLQGKVSGATATVANTPTRIDVTFTRPGATSPDTSKTRGQ